MKPSPDEEVRVTIEGILRCGSYIQEQANLLFKEADIVEEPRLRASIKDVSREAEQNCGYSLDVVLDVWNNKTEEVSLKALNDLLKIMEDFQKEIGVLRGIIRE
jgi:hypothetical protein